MSGADQPGGGREDDVAVAGEYALGLLTPAEARAFEARLQADPALRAVAAAWTEDLAGLADALPPVPPPRRVEVALMRRLFPDERRGARRGLGLLSLLGGGLAAALILLAVLNPGLLGGRGAPELVAEIAAEDRSLVVRAAYDAASGVARFERVAGSVPAGRDRELWLIAGENPPVSLGLLPDAGPAEIVVPPDLRAGLPGGVLAISDEETGGSVTGSPGPVLATGTITET